MSVRLGKGDQQNRTSWPHFDTAALRGFVTGEGNKPRQRAGVTSSAGCCRVVHNRCHPRVNDSKHLGILPWEAARFGMHALRIQEATATDPFWCCHGPAVAVARYFSQWCILFVNGPTSSPAYLCPAKMHSLMYILLTYLFTPVSMISVSPDGISSLFLTLYTLPNRTGAL